MTTLKNISIFFALMYACAVSGYGQEIGRRNEQQMEELAESYAASEDASTDGTLFLEDLSYYLTHPILINQATEEELMRLNVLNFRQVRSLITYRDKYGQILTWKELYVLEDFNPAILRKLEPFVSLEPERDSMQLRKDKVLLQSLMARIKVSFPTATGYQSVNGKDPAYSGNPYSYYTRYRAAVGKQLEFGFTAENDAGEDFFRNTNGFGFDFLSGFFCWNGKGIVSKIIAGDYHLRFGQGVNLWSGGGVSYVSDLTSLMRTGEGIRPYSSTDENLFFRGGAALLRFRSLQLSIFCSDKYRDANLDQDPSGNSVVTSFGSDGLHRTLSELENEKSVKESMCGIYSDFRFEQWRFGILANCLKLGIPVGQSQAIYKSKSFEGDINLNFGIDYHLILNQLNFFGEAGLSQNLKPATVHGMVWKAHPQLSLSFLYRYYDPAFQSFNSGAFSVGGGTRNEEGLFAAFEFFPVAKLKIAGQSDLFYFPWMTYQTISPAHGRILALQAEYAIHPDLMVYCRYRFVCKPQKRGVNSVIPEQWDETTSKFRVHVDWNVSEKVQTRSRLEFVEYRYNNIPENGFLAFQDFIYKPSLKLKCWFRLAYYHTDGYNSRVYSYENDLLYYYAIPEFHGVGIRTYLNVKWQPADFLAIYLKSGCTFRAGVATMGSGNDTTSGQEKLEFRIQICLKF